MARCEIINGLTFVWLLLLVLFLSCFVKEENDRAREKRPMSRKRKRPPPPGAFGTGESRAAEFMTVGWMLTTLTTLICELGGVAATWAARQNPQALGIAALASVLIFAAMCTGLFSLGLLAAAWKLRVMKPPRGITAFALVVSLAPLAMLALRWL
jgi:hypothetical protein